MISPKKLIRMAKKWQKLAARNRKRISFPRINGALDPESCSTSSSLSMAEKGHFAVYSAHQTRFMIPLKYLENNTLGSLCNLLDQKMSGKRCRKGIAHVLGYLSLFTIFISP
ncbi:hypothetical protein JRO89_XS15G0041500 [Xanthoceras sorbifolium]|uniref:Uncharacterized protein n=1 Tax=Xanthoceras sorbifolium TaxID=99658 RepID=A0ABQ8H112_9ROSI|nr:hypothetical protein JRO89_XS15G0041500 [Xanthoceras sorbifolium]